MKKKLALIFGVLVVGWMIYWLLDYSTPPIFAEELISSECDSPCWRGITPGITTVNEAQKIISGFPDRISEDTKAGPYDIFDAYYRFDLANGMQVTIYTINGIVAETYFFRDDGIITFGQAISKFGTPQYATQSFYRGLGLPFLTPATHVYFDVLNVEKGVAFGLDTNRRFVPMRSVNEASVATNVVYFDYRQINALLKYGPLIKSVKAYDLNDLNIWKGYGDICELYPYLGP